MSEFFKITKCTKFVPKKVPPKIIRNQSHHWYSPNLDFGDFDFFGEFFSITPKTPMHISVSEEVVLY